MANLSTFSSNNPNPITGVFGTGVVKFYISNATFTVPTGITAVRVRVWGAGGVGSGPALSRGTAGGGGGFSMRTITGLTPGGTVAVTVATTAGASSSFGVYCSATGGGNAGSSSGAGGSGAGGDINTSGGAGGFSTGGGSGRAGGGGAASMFGNGGDGARAENYAFGMPTVGGAGGGGCSDAGGATAGSSGGNGFTGQGGGAAYLQTAGAIVLGPINGSPGNTNSIDFIGTGGGGGGASGTSNLATGGNGANGGGGGAGPAVNFGGAGGFPGGGSAGGNLSGVTDNSFGRGFVIVEY